jgi:hypothetical protein
MVKENMRYNEESAFPDIERVKGNYLTSYFDAINSMTTYAMNQNPKALIDLKGSVIALYIQIKDELSVSEKKKLLALEKVIAGKGKIDFANLCIAFFIMKHRLKTMRVTDIKIKDGMSFNFR